MSLAHYQFGFIGAGKLAGSVIRGLLLKQVCAADDIIASEPNAELRASLARDFGIAVTDRNEEAAEKAQLIFLGVKPQMVMAVLRDLGERVADKLVVSFAAGVRIESMENVTPARIMRALTNTPSAIGRGATAIAAGTRALQSDREHLQKTFGAIGLVVEVEDEEIDAVTALSGSGPAFIYTMLEALAAGGEKSGLTRAAALRLAAQTAIGAAELLLSSGKSPEELRRMVVTPGGTTAAGLAQMQQHGVEKGICAAVEAAAARGREMARENR